MWIIILIIIVAFIIYYPTKTGSNNTFGKDSANSVPAEIPGIYSFLDAYSSLCNKHNIDSTGVLITCKRIEDGWKIRASTKIFKIDGQDASYSADILRMCITDAKNAVESSKKNVNPVELYNLKTEAANKVILDYFGVDHLTGCFWDIADCDYIDGKYLEFEANGIVFDTFNQGLKITLDKLCADIPKKNPHAQISRQGNDAVRISITRIQ